jgi:hypothetical protein
MRDVPASATTTNYYDVLQVSSTASQEVIQAAYRALARSCHPDVNTSAAAAQRMQSLNAAYRVLGDSQRRAQYDLRRKRATRAIADPFPKPPLQSVMRGRPRPNSPKRVEDQRATRATWHPVRSRILLASVMFVIIVLAITAALWVSSALLDDMPDGGGTDDSLSDLTATAPLTGVQLERLVGGPHGAQPFLNLA